MNNPIKRVAPSSFDEAMKIATGQANKEAPHLTVPFYMPLAQSITLQDALTCCSPKIRKAVESKSVRLLALAHGQMADGPEPHTVQFMLMHGKFDGDDSEMHYLFDCIEVEVGIPVLMDGDGLRLDEKRPLSQQEAVAFWMGGFLGWSEKIPGLYRLRYALIES